MYRCGWGEKGREGRKENEISGKGHQIVDNLGHVFDAEMGRGLSDSGIVGVI